VPDYQNRRRYAVGIALSTTFTLLDAVAKNGTNWSIPSAWSFFTALAITPLMIGTVLDELGKDK
jgi:hypothetical protein